MNKYFVEENIDFYKLLEESLNDTNINNDNNNACLITNLDLTDNFVTLTCNHTFNYIPLYNEIYKQKTKPENLKNNKYIIHCPYCRQPHYNVLSYHPELEKKLIYGINTMDTDFKITRNYKTNEIIYLNTINYYNGKCCFIDTTTNPINTSNENIVYSQLCKNSYVIFHTETQKTYCNYHLHTIKKLLILEQKNKLKEEKQKNKLEQKNKLKEEKQKNKLEQKNKLKEEKQIISGENIIIQLDENKCHSILKTGIRKGNQCNCKIILNNLCKRHMPK